jgi:hypothetical protein
MDPNQILRQPCEARRQRPRRPELLSKNMGRPKTKKECEQNKSGGEEILTSPVHGFRLTNSYLHALTWRVQLIRRPFCRRFTTSLRGNQPFWGSPAPEVTGAVEIPPHNPGSGFSNEIINFNYGIGAVKFG